MGGSPCKAGRRLERLPSNGSLAGGQVSAPFRRVVGERAPVLAAVPRVPVGPDLAMLAGGLGLLRNRLVRAAEVGHHHLRQAVTDAGVAEAAQVNVFG